MIAISAVIPLAIAFFLTVAEAHQRVREQVQENAIYLRMLLLAVAGALLTLGLEIYVAGWSVMISLIIISLMLIGSHGLASKLADGNFAGSVQTFFARIYSAWDELFNSFQLPKAPDPEEFEKEFRQSIEDFGQTVVREVMVPRIDMTTIAADDNLEEALSGFVSSGHSRLPVTGDGPDDIRGVLFLKDIAKTVLENPAKLVFEKAEENARQAIFIPDSKPVSDLLQEMQSTQTQLALIIDEYGGIAGMVTMEDLIEELVGEISDEYDREQHELTQLGDNLFRVNPRTTLSAFGEYFEQEIEDEDVDTVAGLIIKLLDRLPVGGERVQAYGFDFVAERVDVKKGRLGSIIVKKIHD